MFVTTFLFMKSCVNLICSGDIVSNIWGEPGNEAQVKNKISCVIVTDLLNVC